MGFNAARFVARLRTFAGTAIETRPPSAQRKSQAPSLIRGKHIAGHLKARPRSLGAPDLSAANDWHGFRVERLVEPFTATSMPRDF